MSAALKMDPFHAPPDAPPLWQRLTRLPEDYPPEAEGWSDEKYDASTPNLIRMVAVSAIGNLDRATGEVTGGWEWLNGPGLLRMSRRQIEDHLSELCRRGVLRRQPVEGDARRAPFGKWRYFVQFYETLLALEWVGMDHEERLKSERREAERRAKGLPDPDAARPLCGWAQSRGSGGLSRIGRGR